MLLYRIPQLTLIGRELINFLINLTKALENLVK